MSPIKKLLNLYSEVGKSQMFCLFLSFWDHENPRVLPNDRRDFTRKCWIFADESSRLASKTHDPTWSVSLWGGAEWIRKYRVTGFHTFTVWKEHVTHLYVITMIITKDAQMISLTYVNFFKRLMINMHGTSSGCECISKLKTHVSDQQFIPVRHPGWNHHLHTMSGFYSLNGRNSNGGWFHSECFIQKVSVVWVNIFANPWSKALLNWQMRSIFTGSSQGLWACVFSYSRSIPIQFPTLKKHILKYQHYETEIRIRFFFGDGIRISNILNKKPRKIWILKGYTRICSRCTNLNWLQKRQISEPSTRWTIPKKGLEPWVLLPVGGWTNPNWKICSSNWIISSGKGENKEYLKPPTRLGICWAWPPLCSWQMKV